MNILIKCLTWCVVILVTAKIISSSSSSQSIVKTQKIPQILKLCRRNDPNVTDCLRKTIETLRANLTKGIPELMIPPCEPLQIPEISIQQNAGAIRLQSTYRNIIIKGLSNFTLRNISVDAKEGRLQADLWFPTLQMASNYLIHGKILLMPITGNGNAYGNFSDVDATIKMQKKNTAAAAVTKSNDADNKLGDIQVEFNIGSASVWLDNLFNGDPELGSMMNKFLNDNWREITAEIRPALGESIERILYGIGARLNEMYDLETILNE